MPRKISLTILGTALCVAVVAALAVPSREDGPDYLDLPREFEVHIDRTQVGTLVPPHSITIFSPDKWKDDPTWRIEATYGHSPATVFIGELPRDSVARLAITLNDRSILQFERFIREDHWCADQLSVVFSHNARRAFFGRHNTPDLIALPDTLNVRYFSLTAGCWPEEFEEPSFLYHAIQDVLRLAHRYALERISPMDDMASPRDGGAMLVTDYRHYRRRVRSATGKIELMVPTTFGGPFNRLGIEGHRSAYYVFPRDPAGRTLFELSDGTTLHANYTRLTQRSTDGSDLLLLGPAELGMKFILSDNERYVLAPVGSLLTGFLYYRLDLVTKKIVQILGTPYIDDARVHSDGTVDFEINGELYRWSELRSAE